MRWLSRLFARSPAPAPSAGGVLGAAEMQGMLGFPITMGDEKYAVVNSAWLGWYYKDFRKVLFNEGVVRWDDRFDCNHFATFFVSLASIRFYSAAFHSITPAKTLALGEYWYRPGGRGAGHAIVIAITELGPLYLEPQTGAFVNLTETEKLSRFLVKF